MGTQQIALSQIMEDLKAKSISTELAFERLLQEDLDFDELKLKKLRKSLDQSLERGGNEGVLPAISRLLEWEGLESQQEKSQGIQSATRKASCEVFVAYFVISNVSPWKSTRPHKSS